MSVSRGKKTGRSLREKLKAETGNPLVNVVIKATDSSAMAPKSKHIEALLSFTFNSNVPNPQLATALIERTQEKSWLPVVKAMTCVHRLIRDGSMDFFIYLSELPIVFNCSEFHDMSNSEGPVLSKFIQTYNQYLNQKIKLFQKMQFDYCHATSNNELAKLATDAPPRLFKAMDKILMQMDWILNMVSDDSIVSTLGNMAVRESGSYLFKDIMRLWLCANTASVNVLERFFKLGEEQAKEALGLMEKFLKHSQRVDTFVQVCMVVGCSEGKEIPPTGETLVKVLPTLRAQVRKLAQAQDPLLAHANRKAPPPAAPSLKKKKSSSSNPTHVNDPFDPRTSSSSSSSSKKKNADPFATDPFASQVTKQLDHTHLAKSNPQNPFL